MNRPLRGTVNLPGSKSESNRALMIAAYGGFTPDIQNLSEAHDTVLLKTLLERLKAPLELFRTPLERPNDFVFDCEDAGTVARFLLTYLACASASRRDALSVANEQPQSSASRRDALSVFFDAHPCILTGTDRLCQRPLAPLIDALRQLGANITPNTSLPLTIVGHPIAGGSVTLDASQSSQFASSLLLAAPTWEHGLQLTLKNRPVSMPYLEMTIKMMELFGAHITRKGDTITVAPQPYHPRPFTVSADWSAASYWYEMLALNERGGELLLKGLSMPSLQGDVIVAEWFKPFGIITTFEPEGARLTKQDSRIIPTKTILSSQPLVFDFTDNPDLFPAVYATCAALGIDADFKGTETLSSKESDRLIALKTEMAKMPKDAASPLPVFRTYGDHRIAMSLAALWPMKGPIAFDHPEVVNKSYPLFWQELEKFTSDALNFEINMELSKKIN